MSAPRLAAKARLKLDRRENRYILLYPERGLTLSASAAAILRLCDGARTVDEIVVELARDAGADPAAPDVGQIRRDVDAFLGEMRKRGLVEVA